MLLAMFASAAVASFPMLWLTFKLLYVCYRFPTNNVIRQKWINCLRKADVKKSSKLCSNHFEASCFDTNSFAYVKIKHGAVPTIEACRSSQLPSNSSYQYELDIETLHPSQLSNNNSDQSTSSTNTKETSLHQRTNLMDFEIIEVSIFNYC